MDYKIGDKVTVTGRPQYTSYGGSPGKELTNYTGIITHINSRSNVPYPIHVDQKGWFATSNIISNSENEQSNVSSDNTNVNKEYSYTDLNAVNLARRTYVTVVFQYKDITELLSNYFISMDYTDNEDGTADDINITIDDRDYQWLTWLSADDSIDIKGAEISAMIIKDNWNNDGKKEVLDCGTFTVDTVSIKGPPNQITFKASAIDSNTGLKEVRTKAWEKMSLQGIAQEIAAANKYIAVYMSNTKYWYDRIEQNESDIVFLQRLCKNKGLSLKVFNRQIIIFDQYEAEQSDAEFIINRGCGMINYSFNLSSEDAKYNKCNVKYTDPKTKKTIEGSFEDKSIKDGQSFTITNIKVTSTAEANQLAEKRLRLKNKEGNNATFEMPGDINYIAGTTFKIEDFLGLNGKYIITMAKHKVSRGYTTTINARKILEGY